VRVLVFSAGQAVLPRDNVAVVKIQATYRMYRAKKLLKQLSKAEKVAKPPGGEVAKPAEVAPGPPADDAPVTDDAAKKVSAVIFVQDWNSVGPVDVGNVHVRWSTQAK
jgi:hypothetical protein